jgi:parallel beta-helix repeat protein
MHLPPPLPAVLAVAFTVALSAQARAATIFVPTDQSSIQRAVDAARPGDTIKVEPGFYFESVRITGSGKAGLTIEAADEANPPVIHGSPTLSSDGIRVDDVNGITLRNLEIVHAYDGVRFNEVTNGIVEGLHLENHALGVRVHRGHDNTVVGCTIIGARVEQGILVNDSPGAVIAENSVVDSDEEGIRIITSPGSILEGNHVSSSLGSDGINVYPIAGDERRALLRQRQLPERDPDNGFRRFGAVRQLGGWQRQHRYSHREVTSIRNDRGRHCDGKQRQWKRGG